MMGRRRLPTVVAAPAGGFVLVAVLAMLVVLSLLAGGIAATTARLRDDQLERQRLLRDDIAVASTRATVLYLLATQRMTMGGLTVDDAVVLTLDEQREAADSAFPPVSLTPVGNEIRLDGTIYAGGDGVHFSLQDDRGLIGVNWAAPAVLQGYLEQAAPEAPAVPTLRNLLLDYQDPDNLFRLNSDEAEGYLEAGLLPPTNRTLVTPLELRRVKGWREALAAVDDATLMDTFTVARSPLVNINTAPARVLASLPGMDTGMADRVVAARVVQPLTNLPTLYQLVGAQPADEDLLSLYPSGSGILRVWPSRGGQVRVLHWTLTPLDDGGRPWREDYEFTLRQDDSLVARTARPVPAPIFAEPPPPQQ